MVKNNISEDIETLDFEEETEKTTILDFDDISDKEVSLQIDEMLDFTITTEKVDPSQGLETLEELLSNAKDETKVEIDASKEKLDEYVPSIKDFNIKSAKARKIVKKSMLYVIIFMLIGFEFFITRTGDILNDLRVYASNNEPIKIVQNEKYGFIDYTGEKLINPKYTYAEDFVKGYAIVKNSSNLPLIINRGGKEVASSGTYFSLYRAQKDIIASRTTKKGLKYGVLEPNLKVKVPFAYDSIYYLGDVYSFVKDNTVGLINIEGKEIFKYKLTKDEDKVIDVKKSNVNDEEKTVYGVVKVNGTSQIINLSTGKVVSAPTLNEIVAEENNVFYEATDKKNKRYLYVQDDKIVLESEAYKSLSINSINTGVLKAITNSYSYEFISTNTLEQVKKGLNVEDVIDGENVLMYKERNYKKNTNSIVLIQNGIVKATIDGDYEVHEGFKNGFAILKLSDGTFAYINEDGNFINEDRYISASSFDEYGDAIAKKESGYGIIGIDGKVKIEFENNDIKMASSIIKTNTKAENVNVFYAVKKENKYSLYNSKCKKVNKKFYNDIIFDEKLPLFKASTDALDLIIISTNMKEIKLTSFNSEYEAYDNYIIVKNEYYNNDGKLIYTGRNKLAGEE